MIKLKRVYEVPEATDGFRILVDRLWPRGLSKEKAQVDLWFKDIAPSNGLRKWFGHDPERWELFQQKYKEELQSFLLDQLKELEHKHTVISLLYGAHDIEHNQAVILKTLLEE